MKRAVIAVVAFGVAAFLMSMLPQAVSADGAPKDRVVVMYFHRTHRCPTCLKMGGYSEEAVKGGFAKEIQKGTVEFHYIDFQDEKNKALTEGYNVSGPTLVVARVVDNKVAEHKNLEEIWTKVRDKGAFLQYVRSNVKDYQK